MSPSFTLPLLAKLTHPAARSLCDSWATCFSISIGSYAQGYLCSHYFWKLKSSLTWCWRHSRIRRRWWCWPVPNSCCDKYCEHRSEILLASQSSIRCRSYSASRRCIRRRQSLQLLQCRTLMTSDTNKMNSRQKWESRRRRLTTTTVITTTVVAMTISSSSSSSSSSDKTVPKLWIVFCRTVRSFHILKLDSQLQVEVKDISGMKTAKWTKRRVSWDHYRYLY